MSADVKREEVTNLVSLLRRRVTALQLQYDNINDESVFWETFYCARNQGHREGLLEAINEMQRELL